MAIDLPLPLAWRDLSRLQAPDKKQDPEEEEHATGSGQVGWLAGWAWHGGSVRWVCAKRIGLEMGRAVVGRDRRGCGMWEAAKAAGGTPGRECEKGELGKGRRQGGGGGPRTCVGVWNGCVRGAVREELRRWRRTKSGWACLLAMWQDMWVEREQWGKKAHGTGLLLGKGGFQHRSTKVAKNAKAERICTGVV